MNERQADWADPLARGSIGCVRRDAASAVPYSIAPGRSIRHGHTRRQSAGNVHIKRAGHSSGSHAHARRANAGRHLCIVAANAGFDATHDYGVADVHTGAHAGAICHALDRGQHTHTTTESPNGNAPTRAAVARRQPPAAGDGPAH